MNQKLNKFSLTNLSCMEEMKTKLQKLDLIRNTTNAMIVQLDLHRKSKYSRGKKRRLQPLLRLSIQENLFNNKFNDQSPTASHLITPSTNDDHSFSTIHPSIDLQSMPIKNSVHHDSQEDSQISEYSYQKYRTTYSITSSSSSPSKNSRDESSSVPDTLITGRLYILNEIYPSIEYENMNGTPLAFLGAEKLLRIPIDWTKVHYPLSSYHIEIIIDFIIRRPSFIREIPKVTKFNLYRPLIKIISG